MADTQLSYMPCFSVKRSYSTPLVSYPSISSAAAVRHQNQRDIIVTLLTGLNNSWCAYDITVILSLIYTALSRKFNSKIRSLWISWWESVLWLHTGVEMTSCKKQNLLLLLHTGVEMTSCKKQNLLLFSVIIYQMWAVLDERICSLNSHKAVAVLTHCASGDGSDTLQRYMYSPLTLSIDGWAAQNTIVEAACSWERGENLHHDTVLDTKLYYINCF